MIPLNRRTPKSLKEAIKNGFEDSNGKSSDLAILIMEENINDYLAQKFQAAPRGYETQFIDFFNHSFKRNE